MDPPIEHDEASSIPRPYSHSPTHKRAFRSEQREDADWRIQYLPTPQGLAVAQLGQQLLDMPGRVLMDRRRSLVKVVDVGHDQLVLKQPRNKNNNRWIRLTTLWRKGAASAEFHDLVRLQQFGLAGSMPVAVFQKRKAAMVVDSWLVYEYVPGGSTRESHYPEIVRFIQNLHDQGFLHKDPHVDNFIADGSRVVAIDCALVRNIYGSVGRAYNWRRLTTRHGQRVSIADELPVDVQSPAYQFASGWFRARRQIREIRTAIKRQFRSPSTRAR